MCCRKGTKASQGIAMSCMATLEGERRRIDWPLWLQRVMKRKEEKRSEIKNKIKFELKF